MDDRGSIYCFLRSRSRDRHGPFALLCVSRYDARLLKSAAILRCHTVGIWGKGGLLQSHAWANVLDGRDFAVICTMVSDVSSPGSFSFPASVLKRQTRGQSAIFHSNYSELCLSMAA